MFTRDRQSNNYLQSIKRVKIGLNIPNTTNSLDGCFSYLKELVKIHRGSRKDLKRKIIEEILWKKSPLF
jgi:hypothetical protein